MNKYANTLQIKLPSYNKINPNQNIYEYIKETYKLNYEFFILSNSKPIGKTQTFKDISDNTIWQIEPCQKGGGIIDMFMGIIKMGEFFFLLPDIIMWILKTIYWLLRFLPWFFTDFLNPRKISSDIVGALIIIVSAVCKAPFDLVLILFEMGANIAGTIFGGFWGWDQSDSSPADRKSTYF